MRIPLNARTMEGFVEKFLLERFENAAPIAQHHRDCWDLACSANPRVVMALPRGHGKSTAINHALGLAAALFEAHPFQIKVSKTYELACEKLQQAKVELTDNELIREIFQLRRFTRERENDIIAERTDGYQFRMVALGMQQASRGFTWGTMRPSLITGDDMEDDEEVLSADRRDKAMKWVNRSLIPMGDPLRSKVVIFGTILHNDSVLQRLIHNSQWKSLVREACDEQVSVPSILWPEYFPRDKLLEIKQMYQEDGDIEGFNMEYRNLAVSAENSFFRPEDFHPMDDVDRKRRKTYYVGGDLAISEKDHRDYTVFYIGGVDENGIAHIVDERRGRWGGEAIIEEMFSIHEAYQPQEWFIEHGAIKAALATALESRMLQEGTFLNLCPNLIPTKSKAIRAMPAQARMRARGVRWDREASWFGDSYEELRQFTQKGTRGKHDDRVDALAWLIYGLKRMTLPTTSADDDLEQYLEAKRAARENDQSTSFNVTGYEYWRGQTQ